MGNKSKKIDAFLLRLEQYLLERYNYYTCIAQQKTCKMFQGSVSSLTFDAFTVDLTVLKDAITQIQMDIRIVFLRRGNLIGDMRISEGKCAGIITYRLARAHIINICRNCCNNCRIKCISQLNLDIALCVGIDYIHKKFKDLPVGIRQELIYIMKHRHVNQEMLGLVFDTLNEKYSHAKKT